MEEGVAPERGLLSSPVRRRLSPDDEFFDAGNIQRAVLCKMSVYSLEGGDGSDMMDQDTAGRSYNCRFNSCRATFSSLAKYEAHYNTSHRNHCAECGRSFPTNRLLDMHLSEEHDSFFKAMAERRPMYRCLVEGCAQVCGNKKERAAHLVELHRYPKSFDFSRRSYTRETRHEKCHKEVSASGGQRRRSKRNGHRAKQCGVDFEMKVADDGKGCNGTETATDVAPLALDESGDMEVDEIVQGMENLSAKSVPEKLCFGRSARR